MSNYWLKVEDKAVQCGLQQSPGSVSALLSSFRGKKRLLCLTLVGQFHIQELGKILPPQFLINKDFPLLWGLAWATAFGLPQLESQSAGFLGRYRRLRLPNCLLTIQMFEEPQYHRVGTKEVT